MSDQRRRNDGKFGSSYSDDLLYELLRRTALKVNPLDPARLSQPKFDARAAEVAEEQGWPDPPRANAIYMRLTQKRKRTWRQLVERAVGTADGSATMTANAAAREFPAWWFDERHIYFGPHRVLFFLQQRELAKPEPQRQIWETVTYDQYEFGRLDLLASVRGERRDYLDMVLPTAGQIYVMAGRDWNMALRLAQLPEPVMRQRRAAPLFTLLDHFYNDERRIAPSHKHLDLKYKALGLAVPRHPGDAWERVLIEWRADRASRGLQTPPEGPTEDQQLTQPELDALLAEAPRRFPHGTWTPERILAKLGEYVSEFDGAARLTQKHYKAVAPGRGWPSTDVIYRHLTPGRKPTWAEVVALARRYVNEQRRAA